MAAQIQQMSIYLLSASFLLDTEHTTQINQRTAFPQPQCTADLFQGASVCQACTWCLGVGGVQIWECPSLMERIITKLLVIPDWKKCGPTPTFPVKGQVVNVLDFAGAVSVATALLCLVTQRQPCNVLMNEQGHDPIKLYLQKQETGGPWYRSQDSGRRSHSQSRGVKKGFNKKKEAAELCLEKQQSP